MPSYSKIQSLRRNLECVHIKPNLLQISGLVVITDFHVSNTFGFEVP